jgi:glycosyltransferase involved in cell wall biosynthesis
MISHQIYPCNYGGLEVFNYHFIKELASQKQNIWLFTCCDYNWNNEFIHLVKSWKGFPGLYTISRYFSIILNSIKLKDKIDIIHVPYTSNYYLALPILLINKILEIPYVIIIHGGGMYEWKNKTVHRLFFKNANAIVAVSDIIQKEYERRSDRKINFIPPLIPFLKTELAKSELYKKYGFNANDIIILYLGSIKKVKGCSTLFEAFSNLGKEYIKENNLKLIYIGDGILRNELEDKIVEKNLSQHIKFFGYISHEKVPELYKLADIYVIPSLFEGMPISLLEAMFNGLPIIGTNVNGINNLIIHKKNGLLFEKENIDDLKNKIRELINDKNLANKLGRSAKNDYSKGYLFQDMISNHIKLYEECINFNKI